MKLITCIAWWPCRTASSKLDPPNLSLKQCLQCQAWEALIRIFKVRGIITWENHINLSLRHNIFILVQTNLHWTSALFSSKKETNLVWPWHDARCCGMWPVISSEVQTTKLVKQDKLNQCSAAVVVLCWWRNTVSYKTLNFGQITIICCLFHRRCQKQRLRMAEQKIFIPTKWRCGPIPCTSRPRPDLNPLPVSPEREENFRIASRL